MDLQRVIKKCQQDIASEKKKNSPSVDTIKTLEGMIEFISNADTPQEDERTSIKEIFQKHHVASKGTRYVFTKNQEHELDELIIQIKQEMAENTEQYGEIMVAQFFELFMNNMDEWWKKHQFTTWGINKQFRKILSQILSNRISSNNKTGSGKKPSYSSVMNH
jgi:hypothetical protein